MRLPCGTTQRTRSGYLAVRLRKKALDPPLQEIMQRIDRRRKHQPMCADQMKRRTLALVVRQDGLERAASQVG